MKNIILMICLLAVMASAASAQVVPGYMGLKFSVQYQGSLSPQWNNFEASIIPYYSHNVQIGYVVSRRYEVGLQYTRMDYASAFPRGIIDENSSGQSGVITDQRAFTGNNVTAYIKFFRERKGFIAPLGRYYILGLGYENSRDKFHVTEDDFSSIGYPNYTTVKSSDVAIMMGVGRNIILANRLLVTIEGDINLPITSSIRALVNAGGSQGEYNSSLGNTIIYKQLNAVDVMLMNIVQIKIGFGALIF